MTSPDSTSTTDSPTRRKDGDGLAGKLLPELRGIATGLGIRGISGLRKGDLISAISAAQSGGSPAMANTRTAKPEETKASATATSSVAAGTKTQSENAEKNDARNKTRSVDAPSSNATDSAERPRRARRSAGRAAGGPESVDAPSAGTRETAPTITSLDAEDSNPRNNRGSDNRGSNNRGGDNRGSDNRGGDNRGSDNRGGNNRNTNRRDNRNDGENRNNNDSRNSTDNRDSDSRDDTDRGNANDRGNNRNRNRGSDNRANDNRGDNRDRGVNRNNGPDNYSDTDDDNDPRGRRGRRRRERNRGTARNNGPDTEIREDDVVQPVAGIVDVLDNYAFVRTSGYLPGSNDVYVSMNMVRKNGLRRGDAVTGAVKVPRGGPSESGSNPRQKFNPLVRLDTINGVPVDEAKDRPEFGKLTPLYPNQRLRLETEKSILCTRVIDLVMPIGKGQRALIVSPPKAGKTTILQNIANAIAINNPECHLMVVLVDERPEEVTDMQRSVRGEVIASTFDRPPSDHTIVAELAIERAKRLVELGQDVIVLLDSITRLGRAYNNSSPASGRILSGGVDSTALYPPKRFLGAARNIEHGGSLTIIATAMVETGSAGDTVIFEEFKGTGNAELKLDRKIAERRVFPAVDVNPSGTRKEELLMTSDEASIMHKLRRVLSGLDSHQAIDLLMAQLRKTASNREFLLQVAATAPGNSDDQE